MRPGKKKTRHHDSQKCANKAKAKLAAENKASEADKVRSGNRRENPD